MHSFMLTEKIIKFVNAFEILTLITRVHVWLYITMCIAHRQIASSYSGV